MKYRRPRSLILYWHDGELTVENYLEPKPSDAEVDNAVAIDAVALRLLDAFEDWTDADSVAEALPDHDPAAVVSYAEQLADAGLLMRAGDPAAEREERFLTQWANWSEEARFFHFGTKNAVYTGDSLDQRRADAQRIRETGGPPPAIFKSYPEAPRAYLPRTFVPLEDPFGSVLTRRRTHRRFTGAPVDLRCFATALYLTFGPMMLYDAGDLGTLMLRTSPCGGARHELEPYVAVLDVAGVAPGLYHYNVECHALELLDGDFDRAALHRLTYESEMCTPSAFVCFVTAVFARTMWKYRHPRAYRVTTLNAGHMGQTFVLTCTALGLGPWQSAAFRDDEVEAALGIDGLSEGAIYMFGAGTPVPATRAGLTAELEELAPTAVAPLTDPQSLVASEPAPETQSRVGVSGAGWGAPGADV
jgi:SagB-type dehydrogenase family enzyme